MNKYIATVCFFIKDRHVLLVEAEYPDGHRVWNGIGGKVDDNETPVQGLLREIGEETKIQVLEQDIVKADVITEGNFELHVFITHTWSGETVMIDPTIKQFDWFAFEEVPYEQMHKNNETWLPNILANS